MYFLLRLWYSRWRAPFAVGVLALLAAAALVLTENQGDGPTPATSTTPTTTTTLPVKITWTFAPLAEELRAPDGIASPALYAKVDAENPPLLAAALGIDDLEERDGAWSADGLVIERTGGWSYANPDVLDVAASTGCVPGSVCTNPAGSLPPAVRDLPSVDEAVRRAEEILSIGGNDTDVLSTRRDQWRAVVEMHLRRDGVGVGVTGRVVFGPGGEVLQASGTIAEFVVDFTTPYAVPSAEDGLTRLVESGVRLHEGSRTPQSGETVRIVNVLRVSYRFSPDDQPLPILAYEDEYGNVWGLAERNERAVIE